MIRIQNVTKVYGLNENAQTAVDNVSFEIRKGEFVSVVGPSGSGKSTLLHMVGGGDKPTSGDVFVGDLHVNGIGEKELSDYRNQMVGFVFQSFHLEPNYTVSQNVEVPLMIAAFPREKREAKIKEALEAVDMSHKWKAKAGTLSGGEKQRACIARALVNQASVILADEPCGNLDSANSKNIMTLLRKLSGQGRVVMLVTHNLEDAALTDRMVTLKDGALVDDEDKRRGEA